MTSSNVDPGSPYRNPGQGWYPNAPNDWYRDHSIDPNTGQVNGPYPLPPWQIAPDVQQLHNRGVWNYRQNLMQQGIGAYRSGANFALGATGLLQSYRPGGGAALEAGIYGQTAGLMQNVGSAYFQQAAMTEPMDYLFDWRREQDSQARMRANRMFERQLIANTIVGLAQSSSDSGANIGNSYGTSGGGGGGGGFAAGGGTGAGAGGGGGGGGGGGASAAMLAPDQQQGGQQQMAQGQGQAPQGTYQQPQQGQQQDGQRLLGSQMDSQGQQMQQQPGQQQGAQAGLGGGAPAAGSNGDFSGRAYAASAAAMMPSGPAAALMGVSLANYVADLYENDPFYQTLRMAINTRWKQRLSA